jgi:hypothetical protein
MPRYEVTITITLPKAPKSSQLTSTVTAGDVPLAIAKVIDGVYADPRRAGSIVWYRDFKNAPYPRGYHKSEKSILIAAIRKDAEKYPQAMGFPPNFKTPKVVVREVAEEEPPAPTPPKKEGPKQLTLFAFGTCYVSTGAIEVEVPEKTLDKTQVDEVVEESKGQEQTPAWAVFYRVLSTKGLNAFQAFKPESDDPEENDATNMLLKQLRDTDSWILSDGGPVTKIPDTAVKGEITISDLRGGSATQRKVEAYVDGDIAYVTIDKAFVGAPPAMTQPTSGG